MRNTRIFLQASNYSINCHQIQKSSYAYNSLAFQTKSTYVKQHKQSTMQLNQATTHIVTQAIAFETHKKIRVKNRSDSSSFESHKIISSTNQIS